MKINENKSDINGLYKEIGRKIYEKHVREENIDIKTELEEECTKIDVLSAEIETCLKSILEIKNKKQCEQCHAEIDLNNNFCPKCGAEQPGADVLDAEVVKEDLSKTEVEPDNQEEKRIVEEKVSGESGTEENERKNDLERVTEKMAVETQEETKKEVN